MTNHNDVIHTRLVSIKLMFELTFLYFLIVRFTHVLKSIENVMGQIKSLNAFISERIFLSEMNFKVMLIFLVATRPGIAVITELPKAITLYFNSQTLHRIEVHSEFIHILLLCSDVSLHPLLQSFPLL